MAIPDGVQGMRYLLLVTRRHVCVYSRGSFCTIRDEPKGLCGLCLH